MSIGLTGSITQIADRVVPDADAWRSALSGPASQDGTYKEWMHFCVRLPGKSSGHLLVNVNVTEAVLGGSVIRTPRLIVLAELDEWTGSIESFPSAWGPAGGVDARLGENRVYWQAGAYRLSLSGAAVRAELTLRPVTLPSVSSSVSFASGQVLHWLVLPRLEASGWVRVGERRLTLEREPAYHDHNWGRFQWGGELSWEWGFVHPDDPRCPYSLVVLRVSDGTRQRCLSQSALLWDGERLLRTFQNGELELRLGGSHRAGRPFTLPRSAALLAPGASSGVPAELELEARAGGNRLALRFRTASRARIAIPSERDLVRLVLLHETSGPAEVRAELDGRSFTFGGRALMEFVRA